MSKTDRPIVWTRAGIERRAYSLEGDRHATKEEIEFIREVLEALNLHGCDSVVKTKDGWQPHVPTS